MKRIIHNLALAAAVVTLVAAIWQDWGLLATLKKTLIAYLGFFIVGAIMALAVRAVPLLEKNAEQNEKDGE